MFMLPGLPSPKAEIHELADFAELLCLQKGQTSQREVVAYLGRVDDNSDNEGCEDESDENTNLLDDVMNELDRRDTACGVGGYPFSFAKSGTTVEFREADPHRTTIYLYLLLSTRLNMRTNRKHAGIDGTSLLEELATHVLCNYLGGTRSKSLVFGTAAPGGFKSRVDKLCEHLGEGAGYKNLDGKARRELAKDGKLDTVAWLPFSDCLPGKLILFGQCKTGTNWNDTVYLLRPEAFIDKWLRETIVVKPIRVFCVSEAANREVWKSTCVDAGLFLDRCRLVDYCGELPETFYRRLEKWVDAAKSVAFSLL